MTAIYIPIDQSLLKTDTPNFVGLRTQAKLVGAEVCSSEILTALGWTLGAGWTGSLSAGFAHTSGTETLTWANTLATVDAVYKMQYTITGRTAGTVSIKYGNQGGTGITESGIYYIKATLPYGVIITPTTDFDGTIVLSIVRVTSTESTDYPYYGNETLISDGFTLGAGWSGDFASGFTHTSGTATITNSHPAVVDKTYKVEYTVTNRTTGTFTVSHGGVTSSAVSATGIFAPTAETVDGLVITPSTGFDGKIVISVKAITLESFASIIMRNSDGIRGMEIRSVGALYNTYMGVHAGEININGIRNVGIGNNCLERNTSGNDNIGIGFQALELNSVGGNKIAIGSYCLKMGNKNNYCVGVGSMAGLNTTGNGNSYFGFEAGRTITSGTYNLFLGMDAGYHGSQKVDATNSIAIGKGTYTTASNQMILGDANISVGLAQTTPTARLHLPAGQSGVGLAPMKIPSGIVNTTPEAGAIESDGTHLYWVDNGGTRRQLDN